MSEEPRCACGCYMQVVGGWVGDSYWDEEYEIKCNNPNCKLKKEEVR